MSIGEKGICVRILEKEFRVGCSEDRERALKDAADYLDKQMRHIRQNGRILGAERIAMMAALNMANELLTLRQSTLLAEESFVERIRDMEEKIDNALILKNLKTNNQT